MKTAEAYRSIGWARKAFLIAGPRFIAPTLGTKFLSAGQPGFGRGFGSRWRRIPGDEARRSRCRASVFVFARAWLARGSRLGDTRRHRVAFVPRSMRA